MKIEINPFIYPSSHFQKAIIHEGKASSLFSCLTIEGGAIEVCGERRMGKTIILNYIANPPLNLREMYFKNHVFLFLNCSDSVTSFSYKTFWLQIIQNLYTKTTSSAIKEKCRNLLAQKQNDSKLDNTDFLEILDVSAKNGKKIVLVLDDFDALIRTDPEHIETTSTFLQGLRSLTTRPLSKANLVVATRFPLQQICKPLYSWYSSPFNNGFYFYRLQRFREWELIQLLRNIEQTSQSPFNSTEVNYIAYLSGFHPQLAQIAAAEMFEERIYSGFPLNNLIPVGEKFKAKSSPIFASLWEGASSTEQLLLMLIALQNLKGKLSTLHYNLSDLTIIFQEKERELLELTERGLLDRTQADPPQWEVFSPIFQWWILKEIESSHPEQLSDRQKVWGNLVTKEQVDKLVDIIQWIRTNQQMLIKFGQLILRTTGFKSF